MADDSGGVTLKIDADTARYIASIAKAADANKKLHESVKDGHAPMEKLTEKAGEMGKELLGWSGPLTLSGIAMKAIEASAENFHKRLESAKEAINGLASLSQGIIGAGRGTDSKEIHKALEEGGRMMEETQKNAFLNKYLQSNPKASVQTIGRAAEYASNAAILGRDAGQFGELVGSFDRSGIENSGDLANYLMQNAGDSTEKAAQAVIKNPSQANQIAQYASTASRLGKPGQALMQKALQEMMARDGQGNIADYFNERVAGKEHRAELAFMRDQKNLAAPVGELSLARSASEAMNDPNIRSKFTAVQIMNDARGADTGSLGEKARKDVKIEAALTKRNSENTGKWESKRELILEANDVLQKPRPWLLDWSAEDVMSLAGMGNSALPLFGGDSEKGYTRESLKSMDEKSLSEKLLRKISDHMEKVSENTERAPLRPKPDQHGERGP